MPEADERTLIADIRQQKQTIESKIGASSMVSTT